MNYTTFGAGNRHPFGVCGPNGLNLSHSVQNDRSNLRKVVQYLTDNGGSTKREILRDVFDIHNPNSTTLRGWGGTFFRVAVHAGFLAKSRKGNRVYWYIGQRRIVGNSTVLATD